MDKQQIDGILKNACEIFADRMIYDIGTQGMEAVSDMLNWLQISLHIALEKSTHQPAQETLRDKLAMSALAGLLADLPKTLYGASWKDNVAIAAYELADAMLKARSK